MSNEELIAEVAKLSSTLNDFGDYRTGTADYLEGLVDRLADALEAAERKPVIDREALARAIHAADERKPRRKWVHVLNDDGEPSGDVVWPAETWEEIGYLQSGYYAMADAVIASGLIQGKREVQAEALEAAAEEQSPGGMTIGHHGQVAAWLRKRAAEIREGRA